METLHRAPRQFGCIKDQGEIEKQMDLALWQTDCHIDRQTTKINKTNISWNRKARTTLKRLLDDWGRTGPTYRTFIDSNLSIVDCPSISVTFIIVIIHISVYHNNEWSSANVLREHMLCSGSRASKLCFGVSFCSVSTDSILMWLYKE
jgi:hypothetical protein